LTKSKSHENLFLSILIRFISIQDIGPMPTSASGDVHPNSVAQYPVNPAKSVPILRMLNPTIPGLIISFACNFGRGVVAFPEAAIPMPNGRPKIKKSRLSLKK
jgi:hypothetical protein